MVNPIEDLFRGIFAFLDCTIYTFISWAYELLMYLANLDLFGMTWSSNQSIIEQFSSRIYSLLAVFMLFRLAFSLLQYLVDPNKFYDEKRGVSTIVKHVMLSLLLIVTVPMIFTQAFKIQQVILNSDVIGELILGESNSADKTDNSSKKENNMSAEGVNHDMAVDMQFLVLGTFMSINTEAFPSCSDGPVLGTVSMALSNDGKCLQEVSTFLDSKQENINYFFPDSAEYENMSQYPRNIWKYYDIINLRQDGKYLIDYRPILSGITGIFIVILLFRFCIDIAIRVVKLGFLEIVAPIPIVAYMGPSDKESGMLSRWGKECFSTYFALFIRLAILFFAFYVIRILCDTFINVTGEDLGYLYMNGDAPSTGLMSMLVVVMVILGTLIFANQLPKLISKLFNTGEDALGGIGISPMTQINSSPLSTLAVSSVGGLAGAGVANAMYAVKQGKDFIKTGRDKGWEQARADFAKNQHFKEGQHIRNFGRALSPVAGIVAGAASGAVRAGHKGFTTKNVGQSVSSGKNGAVNARNVRDNRQDNDYGISANLWDKARSFGGIQNKDTGVGSMDKEIKEKQRDRENIAQEEEAMRSARAEMMARSRASAHEFREACAGTIDKDTGKITFNEATYEEYLASARARGAYVDTQQLEQSISDHELQLRQMTQDLNAGTSGRTYMSQAEQDALRRDIDNLTQEINNSKNTLNNISSTPSGEPNGEYALSEDEFIRARSIQTDISYLDAESEKLRKEISKRENVLNAGKKE